MHRASLQERSQILFDAIQNASLGWFAEITWHAYVQHHPRNPDFDGFFA